MADFVIDGRKYVSRNIPPMQAIHVMRRVSPFLPSLGYFLPVQAMFGQIKADLDAAPDGGTPSFSTEDVDAIAGSITPTLQMLAAMPDADVDAIFATCLSVVQVQEPGGNFSDVWEPKTRQAMHPFIEPYTMGVIVWEVLKEVIGPLAGKLLSSSPASMTGSGSNQPA